MDKDANMITHLDTNISEGKSYPDDLRNKQEVSHVNDEDIFFAKQRYNLHQSSPEEGVDTDILKKYFSRKYGF